ncbi:MAG TPA: aldolase/citrate lyase family protein [Syntrophorhabdaceae bacterium]|nr:aldolase/citrate lyase family protein [Syntrophorhabdaceae bacterium]
MMNNLKNKLKAKQIIFGPWCVIPSPTVIDIIASTGVDFVIIDMEHGCHNFETVENMIRAAETRGCGSLIRVSVNEESSILKALDLGASGVIVPHIESKRDAELAILYTKYSPIGLRGFSPFTRAGNYSLYGVKDHAEKQNDKTILILLLEGKNSVESLDEILSIDHIDKKVDGIYIGAYDLSQSLGMPGQVDHSEIKRIMKEMIEKIVKKGLAAGGYVAKDRKDLEWMKDMGMHIITLLPDCTVLYHAFEDRFFNFLEKEKKQ